ncbi:hypothetical protein KCP69_13740 [Salmonella enterica subsp. enterica]|nr:hypothetical protein KCP69_13740 [Salmonella enterica subsp. enterica]
MKFADSIIIAAGTGCCKASNAALGSVSAAPLIHQRGAFPYFKGAVDQLTLRLSVATAATRYFRGLTVRWITRSYYRQR